jgi:hypothetical protein
MASCLRRSRIAKACLCLKYILEGYFELNR